MERLRRLFKLEDDEQAYERLAASETLAAADDDDNDNYGHEGISERGGTGIASSSSSDFSWAEYSVFALLGIAMLWAWNMFLAAGPYFAYLFRDSRALSANFQPAELAVSTLTSFVATLALTRMQARADYPHRIAASLVLNLAVFAALAASTAVVAGEGGGVEPRTYFAFLMLMVLVSASAAALCQNGLFAFAAGFGQPAYTQAIMAGQGVAGVLPCVAQIVSVLVVAPPPPPADEERADGAALLDAPQPVRWTSALAYFLTAAVVSLTTLVAFSYLRARSRRRWPGSAKLGGGGEDDGSAADAAAAAHKQVSLRHLFRRLRWFAVGVFLTYTITMVFPVFTQQILSNVPPAQQSRLLQPPTFIPLAFLFWNAGDLLGRMLTAVPALSLLARPRLVFALSTLRVVFVGMYYLCNIRGRGAAVPSDFFYLVVVQLLFGVTNGYLGSTCMMAASEWVEPDEREAAGGFMGLWLVSGLTVGSLTSFAFANP